MHASEDDEPLAWATNPTAVGVPFVQEQESQSVFHTVNELDSNLNLVVARNSQPLDIVVGNFDIAVCQASYDGITLSIPNTTIDALLSKFTCISPTLETFLQSCYLLTHALTNLEKNPQLPLPDISVCPECTTTFACPQIIHVKSTSFESVPHCPTHAYQFFYIIRTVVSNAFSRFRKYWHRGFQSTCTIDGSRVFLPQIDQTKFEFPDIWDKYFQIVTKHGLHTQQYDLKTTDPSFKRYVPIADAQLHNAQLFLLKFKQYFYCRLNCRQF